MSRHRQPGSGPHIPSTPWDRLKFTLKLLLSLASWVVKYKGLTEAWVAAGALGAAVVFGLISRVPGLFYVPVIYKSCAVLAGKHLLTSGLHVAYRDQNLAAAAAVIVLCNWLLSQKGLDVSDVLFGGVAGRLKVHVFELSCGVAIGAVGVAYMLGMGRKVKGVAAEHPPF